LTTCSSRGFQSETDYIRQPLDKMAQSAYTMAVTDGERILHLPQKVVFDPSS